MKIILDGNNIRSKADFYEMINDSLGDLIEKSLGEGIAINNLDGLYDVLSDATEEIVFELANKDELLSDEEGYYGRLMRMLRAAENQNEKILIDNPVSK